jgi:hypothetical protein
MWQQQLWWRLPSKASLSTDNTMYDLAYLQLQHHSYVETEKMSWEKVNVKIY